MPRCALAAGFACVLLAAAPAAAWKPHVRVAREYAQQRHSTVAFAARTPAGAYGYRARRTFPSASVVKAMMLVAYVNQPSVRHRPLTGEERRLLSPMIRRSHNHAASTVLAKIGTRRLSALAHRAHMHNFTPVAGLWGLSRIDAEDQARFFLHIDRLTAPRHRRYAMRLLETVVPQQRWGIARVAPPPGWRLFFKGGWGSGTGLVDHQVALLTRANRRVSVAILTYGNPDHSYGQATLEGVARRLLRGLR